jgi:hypothetical protein
MFSLIVTSLQVYFAISDVVPVPSTVNDQHDGPKRDRIHKVKKIGILWDSSW